MAIKIDDVTIIFNVADIERTRIFYAEHLGIEFERFEEEDDTAYLMTTIGNGVDLMVFPGSPQPGNTPGVVLGLSDGGIDTVIERLAAADVEIVTPVSEAPGGWFADFHDPDGQTISLYQASAKPRKLT
ncbi:VOC family protein [Tritonibacter mobilis]|uniref:VOC family protein n=1 Tax=Tritonibacter mobilis TaxID=379347 RepID=UPI000E0D4070|nr:VOC family protein [Tritonibacter mobilis]